jgi:hypothetical protein
MDINKEKRWIIQTTDERKEYVIFFGAPTELVANPDIIDNTLQRIYILQ